MKSIKFLGWIFYVIPITMLTYTLSMAAPITSQPTPNTGEEVLDLQKDLNKTLYVPIHVNSRKEITSPHIKTVRNSWVSINGGDYQPFQVGEKIRLVK